MLLEGAVDKRMLLVNYPQLCQYLGVKAPALKLEAAFRLYDPQRTGLIDLREVSIVSIYQSISHRSLALSYATLS